MTKFIAVVAEQANQNAIMAIGLTAAEAIEAAAQATQADEEAFIAQPCTDRLYDEVAAYGTPHSWTERNGLQDLEEAEEDESEVDYGTADQLAALLTTAAVDYDINWEYEPTHLFAQFSRSSGWSVAFDFNSDLATSMTQWDTSADVKKLFDAIKAGYNAAAVDYAGDVLRGWEPEWDDE